MKMSNLLFHSKNVIDKNIFRIKEIEKSVYELTASISRNGRQNTSYIITVNENDHVKCISENIVPKQTYELDYEKEH